MAVGFDMTFVMFWDVRHQVRVVGAYTARVPEVKGSIDKAEPEEPAEIDIFEVYSVRRTRLGVKERKLSQAMVENLKRESRFTDSVSAALESYWEDD